MRQVLKQKKRIPKNNQDLERYYQVLQFKNWQLKYPELPRKTAALNTAIGWGSSKHTAPSIIRWQRSWIQTRSIVLS